MVDPLKALGNIRVENILGFLVDTAKDSFDRVMGRATGSEPEAVGLKPGFPFGFQCLFDQSLCGPVVERWYVLS